MSENNAAAEHGVPTAPYSVFTVHQKWAIVLLAGFSAIFSPLGSFIYFPAIPSLAHAFHTTIQKINITVTIYMIFQAVTPSLWGAAADSYGRRPMYIACLALFTVAQIGLALTPTSAYWLLLVLRCISASGSAPVIALSAGTVGDFATPDERGTYMGFITAGPMIGPCIGPLFGGILNQAWGWRAIFWFLAILSGSVLIPVTLFFPETLRTLVGNGSIPAKGLSRTVWSLFTRRAGPKSAAAAPVYNLTAAQNKASKKANPLEALKYCLEKDVAIILFFNGISCAGLYAVLPTISEVMEQTYGLSTSLTGLCYVPLGFGMLMSNITTGKLLDRDFRNTRLKIQRQRLLDAESSQPAGSSTNANTSAPRLNEREVLTPMSPDDILEFPIEYARLRLEPIYCVLFWGSTIGYGWLAQSHAPLAVTLIFLFLIGYCSMSVLQITQVLLVDLYPGKGASIAANNNLFRSSLSAVGTAVVEPMRSHVGIGWTMVIFTCIGIACSPLMLLEWRMGMQWRQARAARLKAEAAAHAAVNAVLSLPHTPAHEVDEERAHEMAGPAALGHTGPKL